MPITQAVASTDRLLGSRPKAPSPVGVSLLAIAIRHSMFIRLKHRYREQAPSYKVMCLILFTAC
jgi:hypothetical protein